MPEKIGIYEFNQMPLDMQADTLHEYGTFLTNVKTPEHTANLYALNDFYVEAVLVDNKSIEYSTYKRGKRLDVFLDGIGVEGLM
jgi:hypothetical protein